MKRKAEQRKGKGGTLSPRESRFSRMVVPLSKIFGSSSIVSDRVKGPKGPVGIWNQGETRATFHVPLLLSFLFASHSRVLASLLFFNPHLFSSVSLSAFVSSYASSNATRLCLVFSFTLRQTSSFFPIRGSSNFAKFVKVAS